MPGGASSLQETYDDWQVNCRAVSGAKDCSMIQTQTRQDGQRMLAVELQVKSGGGASGILILPFGLGLDAGAALALDDGPPSAAARFSTCLPAGCVVPLAFDAKMVAALRFQALTGERRLLQLSLIERVEDIDARLFGRSGGRSFVRLDGRLVRAASDEEHVVPGSRQFGAVVAAYAARRHRRNPHDENSDDPARPIALPAPVTNEDYLIGPIKKIARREAGQVGGSNFGRLGEVSRDPRDGFRSRRGRRGSAPPAHKRPLARCWAR